MTACSSWKCGCGAPGWDWEWAYLDRDGICLFTSAYIVRQGCQHSTADEPLIRDVSATLPALLFFNTGLLLVSSVTMELARRQVAPRLHRRVPLPFPMFSQVVKNDSLLALTAVWR